MPSPDTLRRTHTHTHTHTCYKLQLKQQTGCSSSWKRTLALVLAWLMRDARKTMFYTGEILLQCSSSFLTVFLSEAGTCSEFKNCCNENKQQILVFKWWNRNVWQTIDALPLQTSTLCQKSADVVYYLCLESTGCFHKGKQTHQIAAERVNTVNISCLVINNTKKTTLKVETVDFLTDVFVRHTNFISLTNMSRDLMTRKPSPWQQSKLHPLMRSQVWLTALASCLQNQKEIFKLSCGLV